MKLAHQVLPWDHQMYQDAIDAMKRYYEALASGRPQGDIEKLLLIAKAQFDAVNTYQLEALSGSGGQSH
ncbi:hypothetical protein [Pseudomonas kurunegalensis]|uniref:hypothetical protein n=1 Tax=Pseudomonas kurunegalensis TaxID=485880 RepID=UPI00257058FA|nr:hypothetical protein [Pseudomonas kurunegalensis]WJD60674.1 hypothetical protein QQ992_17215 [Pseudomonas kurunegalensis]